MMKKLNIPISKTEKEFYSGNFIKTRVSFIVLTLNHEKYVEECLSAIEKQTITVDELIILDDGSIDNTKLIIQNFIGKSSIETLKFFNHAENKGLLYSLEYALAATTGDIVFLQAGDDLSTLDRAQITLEIIADTNVNVLYSSYEIIDNQSNLKSVVLRNGLVTDPKVYIKKGATAPIFGCAYTRNFLNELPPISKNLKNEDDFLGMFAVIQGGLLVTEKILYKYRIHEESASSWSTMEMNDEVFLHKFYKDLPNRLSNLIEWKKLIRNCIESGKYKKEYKNLLLSEKLIDQKIQIVSCITMISENDFMYRIFTLFRNWRAVNLMDVILLALGERGALMIRNIRRIRLRIKR